MKKIILLFLVGISTYSFAQIAKVPKHFSVEAGSRYIFSQTNLENQAKLGYSVLFDYGWQLSGLDGKRAASFITVPLGYTQLSPYTVNDKSMSMLNYGWTVRHNLSVEKQWTPFLGYGLLFNNLRIQDREGSVFGHQTRFDFGYDYKSNKKLTYFLKLQYSYTSYPQFDEPERIRMHYADLRLGVRF